MTDLEPLVTLHPVTAAFRAITPDLLVGTYLAPRLEQFDLVSTRKYMRLNCQRKS